MSANSKIEWCDHTFNPWIGCTKVSPGCAHCYAAVETFTRVQRAKGVELWGKGNARHRTSAANWRQPLVWDRQWAEQNTTIQTSPRPRVFCASMADWLDEEVPIEWLADLLKLIHDTPNLDWLLLTKRPGNWMARVQKAALTWYKEEDDAVNETMAIRWTILRQPPANVWIGTSVEDQQRADERIPELLKIPAKVRFLSVEPMLGPINLRTIASRPNPPFGLTSTNVLASDSGLHWVILGGESGPKARPCYMKWIRTIVEECACSTVKAFVKQLGAIPLDSDHHRWPLTLTNPKGGDLDEMPYDLRVREFPL